MNHSLVLQRSLQVRLHLGIHREALWRLSSMCVKIGRSFIRRILKTEEAHRFSTTLKSCLVRPHFPVTLYTIPLISSLAFIHLFIMKTTAIVVSVMALASQAFAAPAGEVEKRSVVFTLASEKNGQGERKTWGVDRWKCRMSNSVFATDALCI